MKTLYLIRHAESENNVDKRETRALFTIWQVPNAKQLAHMASLLKFDMNSELSKDGEMQILMQRKRLEETDFLQSHGIQRILYSELRRATLTCQGLFQDSLPSNVSIGPHKLLYEKDLMEYVSGRLDKRVEQFKGEILAMTENRIVLVGHGGFFQQLLGGSIHMSNCEVRVCQLHENGSITTGNDAIYNGGSGLLDT
jgi:broad specificity phosphatase PhoE